MPFSVSHVLTANLLNFSYLISLTIYIYVFGILEFRFFRDDGIWVYLRISKLLITVILQSKVKRLES